MEAKDTTNVNVTTHENRESEISIFLLNAISGYYADEIVDLIWHNILDIDKLDAIAVYLWKLYDEDKYDELVGAFRMMYHAYGVEIPEIIAAFLQSNNTELLGALFYEFLADFDDLKFEYIDSDDESKDG